MSFTSWVDGRIAKAAPVFAKAVVDQVDKKLSEHIGGLRVDMLTMRDTIISDINTGVDKVDALDGKMGNLQEQLTGIPGQLIKSVEQAVRNLNPFR